MSNDTTRLYGLVGVEVIGVEAGVIPAVGFVFVADAASIVSRGLR
ncbi:hypothetical protein OG863_08050 [Streptomyces decoyicus]|uniref:Uncharacterized protein n=1 Tax=Streptomyces decoyicus TaxID=249567 RepID=A0ABZ1FC43_9ACTN|nr:hypothetical protein [Streptomyces decoyicus]WSB67912.1 hypothetical protein OG863_08050 [Streptomyces decoyicus]